MPGAYVGDAFDLAGFVVGAVEREAMIDGSYIRDGDVLMGLPSSGVHTNGFSLIRHVFNTDADASILYRRYDELKHTLGEELLVSHRCYYAALEPVLAMVKGIAHITGGGLVGIYPGYCPPAWLPGFIPTPGKCSPSSISSNGKAKWSRKRCSVCSTWGLASSWLASRKR